MKTRTRRIKPTLSKSMQLHESFGDVQVRMEPFGPGPRALENLPRAIATNSFVQKMLRRTKNRLLTLELVNPEHEGKVRGTPKPPDRFRATFYDYTNDRAVLAEGRLVNPRSLQVIESNAQPLPTSEEFGAAVGILAGDRELGPAIRAKRLQPYPAMPPLLPTELPDGRPQRNISVGLLPTVKGVRHEIVGVNLGRRSATRFEEFAPRCAQAHNPICGVPYTQQQTTAYGTPGQVWVTVSQAGTVLWKFLLVRPSASSGTRGSGVELRFVDYRGKRVLYRAHVPILNVHYDNDACGPYRDWQWQEGMIQANGMDAAPGFRLCPSPAQTILDTGSDAGNYLGVAIYVQGQEVVLVSEMEAGWYRYISMWRLHADGTIRPRFGFSAVSNSCVCNRHHHHPYWRFDLDIRTAGNNLVREYNDPPLFPNSNWHSKSFEIRRPRDPARNRKWRIENTVTHEAYDLVPGPDDGVATSSPDWNYPRGDVWILRYHGSEIDDGYNQTVGPGTPADLDRFVNGEAITNEDVVIWYGAHVTHDVQADPPGVHGHIAGPTLKLVRW